MTNYSVISRFVPLVESRPLGAPSVAPSAHASRAGASGEVDLVDGGTHVDEGTHGAAAAGGTGVRNSANDDAQSADDDNEPASVLEAMGWLQVVGSLKL